jgi:rRNA processing protein Gar1
LKEIGVILHQAKSGRLIIRLSKEVQPGNFIVDAKGRKMGQVVELIGPVKSPYASVAPSTSRPGKDGDRAFVNR